MLLILIFINNRIVYACTEIKKHIYTVGRMPSASPAIRSGVCSEGGGGYRPCAHTPLEKHPSTPPVQTPPSHLHQHPDVAKPGSLMHVGKQIILLVPLVILLHFSQVVNEPTQHGNNCSYYHYNSIAYTVHEIKC